MPFACLVSRACAIECLVTGNSGCKIGHGDGDWPVVYDQGGTRGSGLCKRRPSGVGRERGRVAGQKPAYTRIIVQTGLPTTAGLPDSTFAAHRCARKATKVASRAANSALTAAKSASMPAACGSATQGCTCACQTEKTLPHHPEVTKCGMGGTGSLAMTAARTPQKDTSTFSCNALSPTSRNALSATDISAKTMPASCSSSGKAHEGLVVRSLTTSVGADARRDRGVPPGPNG